jgi:hypothetical protein
MGLGLEDWPGVAPGPIVGGRVVVVAGEAGAVGPADAVGEGLGSDAD